MGICGERGIRTPGSFTFNGFQDRRNRPLCHLSGRKIIAPRVNSQIILPYFVTLRKFVGLKHLKAVNKYFWKYRWRFLLGLIFVILSNYFRILTPQVTGYVVNSVERELQVQAGRRTADRVGGPTTPPQTPATAGQPQTSNKQPQTGNQTPAQQQLHQAAPPNQ